MLNFDELNKLKRNIRDTIRKATEFMLKDGMDENRTKVRSVKPQLDKYGIWPTAEFLEFLLTDDTLPATPEIAKLIEDTVGFIIDKYDGQKRKWPLTDADGSPASAITSGHCIYVLKLYLSRPYEKMHERRARQIIKNAEGTLLDDYRRDNGGWKILDGDDALDKGLNYGRFFYTYNAWFGIKNVTGFEDDLQDLTDIKRRLAQYVMDVSDMLLSQAKNEEVKEDIAELSTLICNIAKAIQILSDYHEDDKEAKKNELRKAVREMVNASNVKYLLSCATSVELTQLPNSGYNKFSNNLPFDLFFAIKDEPDCVELAREIIDWYLARRDKNLNCWTFPGSDMNTWPTCEALLVLSSAYAQYLEVAVKNELAFVEKKYKQCDECRERIDDYKQSQKFRTTEKYVRKVRKMNYITMAITIFVSVIAIVALIILSEVLEMNWIYSLITVAIVPTIIQTLFTIKSPNAAENEQEKQDVVDIIDESQKKWKS